MRENNSIVFCFVIALFLSSCTKDRENSKLIEPFLITVVPLSGNIATNEPECHLDYILKIQCLEKGTNILNYGVSNEADYQDRLYYFSYQIENDLSLSIGNKTYSCSSANYERKYHLSPVDAFNVSFKVNEPCSEINEPIKFSINSPYLQIGKVNIIIKS